MGIIGSEIKKLYKCGFVHFKRHRNDSCKQDFIQSGSRVDKKSLWCCLVRWDFWMNDSENLWIESKEWNSNTHGDQNHNHHHTHYSSAKTLALESMERSGQNIITFTNVPKMSFSSKTIFKLECNSVELMLPPRVSWRNPHYNLQDPYFYKYPLANHAWFSFRQDPWIIFWEMLKIVRSHTVKEREKQILHLPPDPDLHQNVMSSSLTYKTSFHHVSWSSVL